MSEPLFNPSRRRLLNLAAAGFFLTVSPVGLAAVHIVALRIWPSSTYTRLTLESGATIKFTPFTLSHPERLVIDLSEVELNKVLKDIGDNIKKLNDPFIASARAAQFSPNTVRIVLDLKKPIKPHIFTLAPYAQFKNRLVIDLYPQHHALDDPLLSLLEEYNQGQLEESKTKARLPREKRPIVIMLDPGHGGEDPGAIGPSGYHEKNIVLAIAKQLKRFIAANHDMRIYMTREDDIFIPLGVRVAKARRQNADLFISIHADAYPQSTARGTSVFALSEKGATSAAARYLAKTQNNADFIGGVKISPKQDLYLAHTLLDLTQTATLNDSLKLGESVLGRLGELNRLHKPQVEQAGFAVLKAPDIPSILVETAFISNPLEERLLINSDFQQKIALKIYTGIEAYLGGGG